MQKRRVMSGRKAVKQEESRAWRRGRIGTGGPGKASNFSLGIEKSGWKKCPAHSLLAGDQADFHLFFGNQTIIGAILQNC